MKIDVNNAITITLGLLALMGYVWKFAEVKADINARIAKLETNTLLAIDTLKDSLIDKVYTTDKKLDIHLIEYTEKKLFTEYRLNGTDKLVEHKFNRLANWLDQIAGFLHKQSGFQIRDDKF
jgi:hypothetical protein